jgi:hypothetical protein
MFSAIRFASILVLATSAGMASAQAPLPASATSAAPAAQVAPAAHAVIKPGDRTCLQQTGSLIRAKPGQCLPVAGRSYSGEELRRTGTPDTARALQMLDPSISVGR